uniref:Uncharacterized protein n=1 Tax=Acrobeloides nanus TaxID=290746 RepID=A0A914EA19_9BILA
VVLEGTLVLFTFVNLLASSFER